MPLIVLSSSRWMATASLCLTAMTHTYLLFHCFPYLAYQTRALLLSLSSSSNDVSLPSVACYAGWLGTAFTAGRCLSFGLWKRVRSLSGVRNTLLLSLALSALASLWYGLSSSFISALAARFALGLANALSGCVKRAALDYEQDQAILEQHHNTNTTNTLAANANKKRGGVEWAPARVLAVMWWGSALGPLVGGFLSDPGALVQLPIRHEFFLPNLVGALLCVTSLVLVALFVPKSTTSSRAGPQSASSSVEETRPLLPSNDNDNTNGITNDNPTRPAAQDTTWHLFWNSTPFRRHFLAYGTFSFVVILVDEALPLYLVAQAAWLPRHVGIVLATAGFLVLASQGRFLDPQVHAISQLYPNLKWAALGANVPAVLVPLFLIMARIGLSKTINNNDNDSDESDFGWLAVLFLAALLGVMRMFSSRYFAHIGVASGRSVPPQHRDSVARVMTLGALVFRAVAPVVAGGLVTLTMTHSLHWISAVTLWTLIGVVFGLGAAYWTFQLEPPAELNVKRTVQQSLYLEKRQKNQVFMQLWDEHNNDSNSKPSTWQQLKNLVSSPEANEPPVSPVRNNNVRSSGRRKSVIAPRRGSWAHHVLQVGIDPEDVSFYILGTHKHDKACQPHVLTPPLMEALHPHLPQSCSDENFWLRFSLLRDGASLVALEASLDLCKNTFLAIETLQGDVFGCFMTTPWKRTSKYEMCGESFLWRMRNPRRVSGVDTTASVVANNESNVQVFPWSGQNEHCQLLSHTRLAVGSGGMTSGTGQDGFGLVLDEYLSKGSSSPCETYDNPSLVAAKDGVFEVVNVEVWAMTPFLFASDAEKSLAKMRFLKENSNTSSTASPWTNFL